MEYLISKLSVERILAISLVILILSFLLTRKWDMGKIILSLTIGLAAGFGLQVLTIETQFLNGNMAVGLIGGPVISLIIYGLTNHFVKKLELIFWVLIPTSFLGAGIVYLIGISKTMN